MNILLTLTVDDDDLVDPDDSTGLTEEGYNILMDALTDVGFAILSGPDKV